jgi:hypothetical protein
MWLPIADAPYDLELELAVIDDEGAHALAFPCERWLGGWINARNGLPMSLTIHPSHWRVWKEISSH